ncbi:uncharacterized protein LOC110094243 [Dendrobium catenatum]|uniref:DUF4408 domain-containing protein n=1 Tax=Dendrobium catenatum TaxID=906689 RepID=A0A2I0X2Z5_9ASPA|nr:uncharacterized protein LOC110094243 [Dendrobium catenatum]PKU82298.1 hypothetical protein MA16_Dca019569 [Dendrobium catenatum]
MKQSPQKKTSISIVLVLSILLLYLSLLNISPTNLIKDTAFWFLLSNSIIFIVAVDYGVFSPPVDTDIYDEFIRHNRSYSRPPCLVIEKSESRENVNEEKDSLNCSELNEEKDSLNCSENETRSLKNEKVVESFPAEKPAASVSSSGEEENEYSMLSDEELNRRVEEFIKKFNRQLSSQGVRK